MTSSEIARILRARRHSGYWMARCPVHGGPRGDSRPSLSLRDGKKGVTLHCFAGCSPGAILSALGLSWHDLGYQSEPAWKERIRREAIRPAGKRKPLGKLEATYSYTDERGELAAEKLRFEGKVFLWRRPQAGGGWIWKVDRATLPLFLLHDLVPARIAILTEGEKDVLSIRRVVSPDVAVTTAPNGAKSWRADYARWFAGKAVWIVPDSDAPGKAYAEQAARDLQKTAKCVRVVSVAPAKDATDYLASHSADEWRELFMSSRLRGVRK